MADNAPYTVGDHVFSFIFDFLDSLWAHANAKDLGLADDDGTKKAIIRIYRLVFVSAWLLLMIFIFQDGSASVSHAMIKDKLRQEDIVDRPERFEKNEECVQTRVPSDVITPNRNVQQPSRREPIAQTFRRCLRGWLLSTLYYSVLFGLFCLIDLGLGLQHTSTRCMAFMLASALSAPLHMLWTQTLVSPQVPDSLWSLPSLRKLASLRDLGALLVPSLAYSGSQVFCTVGSVFIVHQFISSEYRTVADPIVDMITIVIMVGVTFTCVHVPAAITLTRIEWSLMACHDATEGSGCCSQTLPIVEVPLANQPKRKIELLEVTRTTYLPVFRKTLKVYFVFIAALVASLVLFVVG